MQVIDQGLKFFIDNFDNEITIHIQTLTKLDYLDRSDAVIKVVQMALQNLTHQFSTLAKES